MTFQVWLLIDEFKLNLVVLKSISDEPDYDDFSRRVLKLLEC